MTTIIVTFIIALLSSLALTPLVRAAALRHDIVDHPSNRKIHRDPVPRTGGIALYLSFLFPFSLFFLLQTDTSALIFTDILTSCFFAGSLVVFFTGLWDDLKSLPWYVKLAGQIIAALAAYLGGIKITVLSLPLIGTISFGVFSLPVTLFWFVLVINAINLIDGLDGLAAGISLFVAVAMLFICITTHKLVEALIFTALAGSLIGFLRYNFFPASIFMGDSGSYFLGYALAGLGIMGSIKGQVTTAMLIPIIALGVPLIDTLWSPLRRFALGKKMFQADQHHLHHRLINMGYSQRRAVLTIYGCTILLGTGSIALVHTRDETAALILLVLGLGTIFLSRYIGMSSFLTMHKMLSWLHDISDETGITHERRSFLNHQLKIIKAGNIDQLWIAICNSLENLKFDRAELRLYRTTALRTKGKESKVSSQSIEPGHHFKWQQNDEQSETWSHQDSLLKIEMPLQHSDNGKTVHFGTLLLIKDLDSDTNSHYTLKRVEHLRRSIITALQLISKIQQTP